MFTQLKEYNQAMQAIERIRISCQREAFLPELDLLNKVCNAFLCHDQSLTAQVRYSAFERAIDKAAAIPFTFSLDLEECPYIKAVDYTNQRITTQNLYPNGKANLQAMRDFNDHVRRITGSYPRKQHNTPDQWAFNHTWTTRHNQEAH